MLLNCGFWEDSWESLGLQGDPTSPSWRRSVLGVHWKDWCWSWSSNTLASSCEELTHLKRPWFWERLNEGGERDDRGWDGWMASLTWWPWVRASSGRRWRTGRPGILLSMGSQSQTRPSDWTAATTTYIYLLTKHKKIAKHNQAVLYTVSQTKAALLVRVVCIHTKHNSVGCGYLCLPHISKEQSYPQADIKSPLYSNCSLIYQLHGMDFFSK